MSNDAHIETELIAARDDLATGFDAAPLPPFKPTRRKAPAVVAALLLVIGGGAFLGLRGDGSQTVRLPVAEESEADGTEEELGLTPETTEAAGGIEDSGEAASEAVFGRDAALPAEAGRPDAGLLEWSVDPVYQSQLRQFTSSAGTRFDVVTSPNRSVENADGSMVLTYHGTDGYRVSDRLTGEDVGVVNLPFAAHPQWHPNNRTLLRHLPDPDSDGALWRLLETDVLTGETEIIADLGGRLRTRTSDDIDWPDATRIHTNEQGAPSTDGSLWAFIVDDADGQSLGIVTYDLAEQQLIQRANLRTDVGAIDHIAVSLGGGYVVVTYDDATFVYDRNLENERRLVEGNHPGDFAFDAQRSETYVVANFADDEDAGWLVAIDLDTLNRTRVFDIFEEGNTSMNISGRGFDRPGWAVVSTFDCKAEGAWTCDKVMAVELTTEGRIVNLAHTYNCGASFWTEPSAVPSHDLQRVYFNSDSGSCGEDGEVFQLRTPRFE